MGWPNQPGIGDDLDVVAGKSLLGVLRDLLRIRVEDVVSALDDRDFDLASEELGILV